MMFDHKVTGGAKETILITQGEYAVSEGEETIINTLLGSCIACCLWDPTAKVGGMNHLLLAGERVGTSAGYDMAGVAEMECLINSIIKLGGRRENLQSKVFGGAQMLDAHSKIGENNAQFAFDYLKQENIPCQNSSVGGRVARALRFWPATGRVTLRMVNKPVEEVKPPIKAVNTGNDMELF